MISYQSLYERAQSISSDDDTASLALFKVWISEGVKKAYSVLNAEMFYEEATDKTEESVNSYPLPPQCSKVHTIKTTVSSVDYTALEWTGTEPEWNVLTDGSGSTESVYPQWFFVKKDTFELYPTPSTDDYVLTIKYKIVPKDLSADDSLTSTIKTLTNGATTVTANAAAFTAAMVGRFFKIDDDGVYYKIASYTSTTVIELAREYGGTSVTAGTSAYTIGECSLLPNEYQEAPLNYALYRYYLQKENDKLATIYKTLWEENLESIRVSSNNTTSGIISEDIEIRNANNYPLGLD